MTASCVAIAVLVLAASAAATTFILPRDETLARQASVIAEVAVMSVSPSPAEGAPSTDYIVLVERLLKGRVSGTSVVVRVPGGTGPDGIGLDVHGAPVFREGERLLLFLLARDDGAYAVLHLGLGAFHQADGEAEGEARLVALRHLLDSTEGGQQTGLIDAPRDWTAFTTWLSAIADGGPSTGEYFLSPDDLEVAPPAVGVAPMPTAWERFSHGRRVRWRSSVPSTDGRHLLRRALYAWSEPSSTSVRLRPSRSSGQGIGVRRPDGFNDLVVGDPGNIIAGSFSCRHGGVASVSATWFDSGVTFRFRPGADGVARAALEAEIVINDGAECLLRRSVAEDAFAVLAHEIGHTLGLEHSAEPASPMFPVVLGRSELALEGAAEESMLRFLYPSRPADGARSRPADSGAH